MRFGFGLILGGVLDSLDQEVWTALSTDFIHPCSLPLGGGGGVVANREDRLDQSSSGSQGQQERKDWGEGLDKK